MDIHKTIHIRTCIYCGNDDWQIVLSQAASSKTKSAITAGAFALALLGIGTALAGVEEGALLTNAPAQAAGLGDDGTVRGRCVHCRTAIIVPLDHPFLAPKPMPKPAANL